MQGCPRTPERNLYGKHSGKAGTPVECHIPRRRTEDETLSKWQTGRGVTSSQISFSNIRNPWQPMQPCAPPNVCGSKTTQGPCFAICHQSIFSTPLEIIAAVAQLSKNSYRTRFALACPCLPCVCVCLGLSLRVCVGVHLTGPTEAHSPRDDPRWNKQFIYCW